MEFTHVSVLLQEAVDALKVKPDGVYVDATAGAGGHSAEILRRLGEGGRLLCFDQDPDAIAVLRERFKDDARVTVIQTNFSSIRSVLGAQGVKSVDGILADLGVSSHQLDTASRGFSFHADAPLDMRMSQSGVSAADLCNTLSQKELARIFWQYGEEKCAKAIARNIVLAREQKPIETTLELAELVKASIPARMRRTGGHPARRTFQALRIAVNGELDHLKAALDDMFDSLSVGGRLAVITFHSLEDRMVKQKFASLCTGCTCPPDFPVCVCGKTPRGGQPQKALSPGEPELTRNPRARSARLRVIEKIKDEENLE
ncbi:MAG: 16S rRNA (cytosine(1402)-N(4))-methyltransferase RsmH [Clostridia bacterium]|nr:16S rRNA (cytosine(1402)-N(4))-methyltransferase RsmH [Clostridia bacterium]